jgi:iron complex outermembrane receptor protein
MYGAQIDSGMLSNFGNAQMMFNASRLTSDGYLTYSSVTEDNYQFKFQRNLGRDTVLTVFSTYNKINSYVPDKGGVTLSQVAQFGKNYALNNDPASQNYYGYNFNYKTTDFDYIRLQSKLAGWNIDNTLYTYSYNNDTYSGQDASGATANGTKAGAAGNKNVLATTNSMHIVLTAIFSKPPISLKQAYCVPVSGWKVQIPTVIPMISTGP